MQDSGGPFGLPGVKFSRGFIFRRRKSPLLALESTNFYLTFKKNSTLFFRE